MIVPNYFKKFKCIADKCTHSCCVGWEIDIDSDTQMFYSVLPGEIGDKIRENISNDLPPHFILKNNKCPFLNEKGLCDIILNYGQDSVCEICREHPRFYNEYKNFTEAGVGLCCEEAAKIILESDSKFSVSGEYKKLSVKEKEFLAEREKCFNILQDRVFSIAERFKILSEKYGFAFEKIKIKDVLQEFMSLERLDNEWSVALSIANDTFNFKVFEEYSVSFEQFSVYLIYRHLKKGYDIKNYSGIIKFVIYSCIVVAALLGDDYSFSEIARMFSCEVEYSEKNLLKILNKIKEEL